jgi:hypothetical protein
VSSDLRIALIVCTHLVMTGSLIWLIGTAGLQLSIRIVAAALAAAVLLPWLQALAARRLDRISWLALLLVFIIGIGIVEVLATGAHWRANILLGSAMLEFAVLVSLSRGRRSRESSESAQR